MSSVLTRPSVPSPSLVSVRPAQAALRRSPLIPMGYRPRVAVLCVMVLYAVAVAAASKTLSVLYAERILLGLVIYLALLAVPIAFYRPSYGWFHPLIFGSLMELITLFRRFPMYASGLDYHQALIGYRAAELNPLIGYHLLLMSLGLATYYAGFFLAPRLPVPRLALREPKQVAAKCALIVGLALLVFSVFIAYRGGLSAHLLSWGGGRKAALEGEYYWIFATTAGSVACLLWLAFDARAHRSPLFWSCCAVSLTAHFLASGGRGALVGSIGMGLAVWMLRTQRVPYFKVVALAACALVLLGMLGSFRRSTWKGSVDWSAILSGPTVDDLSTGASEASNRLTVADGTLPILALVPNQVPFLYGNSYLALAAAPVPRALWPEKPGLVGGMVGRTFFKKRAGVPAGVVGEAFWNFHTAGVAGIFFLWGGFHRWVLRLFQRYPWHGGVALVYVVTLFRGVTGGAGMVQYGMTLCLLVLTVVLLGAFGRRRGGTR